MNKCLNCGSECKNKFCCPECYWKYFFNNKEYKKAFIDKLKEGKRLEKNQKK